ncbi:dynamin family protein [Paenibacillus qinlingensis]|uniref:GTPase Era involved in 16S rRNA processing n=1 Tax=Paenibacillus qinlingensis TaxID=1837343 RepID=A0ABU1NQ12_9BACL|nr:dynamin family protein [Paenibacillus qinlingensis]MDR6549563.1 GTPase Era involved in 16S rRNA processing [Paenibacillus qinlingensis]
MSQLVARSITVMPDALKKMQQVLGHAGDEDNAAKMGQLLDKLDSGRMNIAFCGHFSAGKSTLINQLCAHALLPSSPIPTSANIVSIRNGQPGAHVTHRSLEGKVNPLGETTTIPLSELEAYCVNGTDIETVEITYPIPFLGEDTALLDTPGIDSTDDAHHQSTESALHLADVVFYVMDYNHVQSEVNLAFTKKMKEWGKPLYLVVNMIDKHKEWELPFAQYQTGTKQAFLNWGIEPDDLLFVTMKEPAHPHNEYAKLQWLLSRLIERGDSLRSYSIDASARYLAAEHSKWLAEQHEPQKAELLESIKEDGDAEDVQQLAAAKQEQLNTLKSLPETLILELRKDVGAIIENANITPALTRDYANAYLESRKPGFKVGFFGGAAKTAAEQEKRLTAFQGELAEQVEAQLDWHLRDALKKAASDQGQHDAALIAQIEALKVEVSGALIASQVNTGATFNGEYTLNYMKQLAGELKLQYRKLAFAVIDIIAAAVRDGSKPAAAALAAELEALSGRLSACRELARLEEAEAAAETQLLRMASWERPSAPALPDAQLYTAMEEPAAAPLSGANLHVTSMGTILQAAAIASAAAGTDSAGPAVAAEPASSVFTSGEHGKRMERKAADLQAASALIDGLPSMRSLARSMREKADRLRQRTFTIALFGAFSAGKSSFANALIGERVLPVSPNPTTAAINKIMPPTEGWPHGTAKVKMKKADAILEDVLYSLQILGVEATDMSSALKRIGQLSPADVTAKGKPHFSFLKAVEKGWEAASGQLGTELRITKDEFSGYVAEEHKSCFVEFIELYYSNPLTDQGIIFVDTPGADSINARHTGVAFNYIKNADAILFVTYYNHAFSQADREFLLQLGRVKDSFEMDKMFFIVNASDLAASSEELAGVVKHVETNLVQHGIRHPRIYPISSYLAAEGKINGNESLVVQSGIQPFEQQFVQFTLNELSDVAIHSANLELHRAISTMQKWLERAQSGEEERRLQLIMLDESEQQGLDLLDDTRYDAELKELKKEIQELMYYVKQRTMYRFGELYNFAFNPSTFRDEAKDPKAALQFAWNELLRMIGHDLSQEVLATTLRVENRMNLISTKRMNRWGEELGLLLEGFEKAAYESSTFVTPEVTTKLEASEVSLKLLQSYFKNAKQFFEGDGKSKLKAELENRINAPVVSFIEGQTNELEQAYGIQLEKWLISQKLIMEQQVKEHAEGLRDALQMKIDLDELISKQHQLKAFV